MHRWGLNEGIENHLTVAIKVGSDDRYLVIPYGIMWNEVRASTLLLLDDQGRVCEGEGSPDPTAFFIHACIHKARGDSAKAIMHTHQSYTSALCCAEHADGGGKMGELAMTHQNSLRFFDDIVYDSTYNGLVLDDSEGERIVSVMGEKRVYMHQHHGPIVAARTVARALDDMYFLERAAKVQIMAESTGRKLLTVEDRTARSFREASDLHGDEWAETALQAYFRQLDREEPDYKE